MAALIRRARLWAPALVATVLLTVLMTLSTAVARLAPQFPDGTGGPAPRAVLGAVPAGPNAAAVRSDARLPALRGCPGTGELDLLSGHQHPHRSLDPAAGWPVPASASGPLRSGDARRCQGRAPPHTP